MLVSIFVGIGVEVTSLASLCSPFTAVSVQGIVQLDFASFVCLEGMCCAAGRLEPFGVSLGTCYPHWRLHLSVVAGAF